MRILFFIFIVFASSTSYPQDTMFEHLDHWELFKAKHNKNYESFEEEEMRKTVFMENLNFVHEHNLKHDKGEVSYRAGINKYSDLSQEEASNKLHGCRRRTQNSTKERTLFYGELTDAVPKTLDWRKKGALTGVKDQGHCGSCWAFAATGSLESMNFLKTGKLVSLSEQNLLDCDKKDKGCGGGMDETAFEYIVQNGGIDTEAAYPYTAKEGKCQYNPKTKGASVKEYVAIPSGNEELLKVAVATKGPVVVALDATNLMGYTSGVFSDPNCKKRPEELDHAVVVVGYGTTDRGEDYWLIKNSWGTSWGMDGYFMLARNKDNMCGVASEALFPVVP